MSKDDISYINSSLRKLAVPIDTLTPDPSNARLHNERNMQAIKSSLSMFGQAKPIVVQQKGMVVRAGNGTLEAARQLGWTHIAANVVDMDNATAVQYAIADNRTAELAEWDFEVLSQHIGSMDANAAELLGFNPDDLADVLRKAESEFAGNEQEIEDYDEESDMRGIKIMEIPPSVAPAVLEAVGEMLRELSPESKAILF